MDFSKLTVKAGEAVAAAQGQRRAGRDPVFTRDRLPGVTGIECWEDELTVTGPIDTVTKTRQAEKHRDHLHHDQSSDQR